MSRILISGGAGFIGTNLARKLLARGHEVAILDNLSTQIHGDVIQDRPPALDKKVCFLRGDVRSKNDWLTLFSGFVPDTVVHLAAETGTGQSMYEIDKYVDVNVRGTAVLLDILSNMNHSVKRIIVSSSRAVYGEGKYRCKLHGTVYPTPRGEVDMIQKEFNPKCPLCKGIVIPMPTDEETPVNPLSVYAITKNAQENLILTCCNTLGIQAIAFRYQNVYGPGQSLRNPYTGILSVFSTRIRNGRDLLIFEDGLESRDFVFVDDVVDATMLGITCNEHNTGVFNVGSGTATSILQLAEMMKSFFKSDVEIKITGNFRHGDIRHNVADLTKTRATFAFEPRVSIETGLKKFIVWVNNQSIEEDRLDHSIVEMKRKGLLK